MDGHIDHNLSIKTTGKVGKWIRLVIITGSAQGLVQVLGLVTGILIVRFLSTSEYAFYTLANTMLGTMTVLADGGISSGVLAQGGKVWQDRTRLGIVIATGLKLRKSFGIVSLLVFLPVLGYLLVSHGATKLTTCLILLAIIPSFFAALSDNLLEIASKLHQGIGKLQTNQIYAGLGRCLMITVSLFVFPWTYIIILGNGLPRLWANFKLRRISAEYADPLQEPDPIVEKEILSLVKRSLPGAIYYCVSGQITIWLISIFGNTQSIAHIGALGRLTTALTVFTTLFSTLIIPRFARLLENKRKLLLRFLQVQLGLVSISLFILTVVIIFPTQILWVLGKDYINLKQEMVLITISGCLAMLAGVTYSLVVSRGWIINPVINISINLVVQGLLVFSLDLTKTTNVLLFSIVDFSLGYFILLAYFFYRLTKII